MHNIKTKTVGSDYVERVNEEKGVGRIKNEPDHGKICYT